MEFFRDTNIDFMKYRKFWIIVSLALLAVGLVTVFVHGRLNLGIDFAGGTQLTLKFKEPPKIDELRNIVGGAGVGEALIQRFGEQDANEVMIKTPTLPDSEEGSRDRIVGALEQAFGLTAGAVDLNDVGSQALADLLFEHDPDQLKAADADVARAHYEEIASAILGARQEKGLFASWDDVAQAPGIDPVVVDTLRQHTQLGSFAVVGAENVGPQIGAELRKKGMLAVLFSLAGMLIYIWYRFELRFGVGALMAAVHDVLVTLGLFALFGFEFNLTTVAGFLTLVGYSVNDTVVIFDRVRENMRRTPREPMVNVMNVSINQTLSRTLLTSGTTLLAVAALLVLGGDVLRGFAFIMTLGVIVGTYSSYYIASPFALLWEQVFSRQARSRRGTPRGNGGRTRTASSR